MSEQSRDRIAFFVPSLEGGGAERMMVNLANGFSRAGFEADLVVLRPEGAYRRDVLANVRVVSLGRSRVGRSVVALAKYLRASRPRVLVSAMNYVNVVAVLAKVASRVETQVVLTERSNLSEVLREVGMVRAAWLRALMRITYPVADKVLGVSRGVCDDLIGVLGLDSAKVDVLYNSFDVDEIRRRSMAPLAHVWFSDSAPPVVLSVGRLVEAKEHHVLLDAFEILRRSGRVRLVILGDGPLRSEIVSRVELSPFGEDILVMRFDGNPYRWMRKASVLVLSSKREGFGNVLVEAMACGTPVVSTDCPSGPSEILEGGRWGGLVPVGDSVALAHAIAESIGGEQDPASLEGRARAFSLDGAVSRFVVAADLRSVLNSISVE